MLEYLQNFSPGRRPAIRVAVAGSLGETVGIGLTASLMGALAARPDPATARPKDTGSAPIRK